MGLRQECVPSLDPRFVNVAGVNLGLRTGSPARDAARFLDPDWKSARQRVPQGVASELGALEALGTWMHR